MEITTEKKPSLTIELPYNHDQDKGDDVYTVMVKVSIRGVEAEVPLIKLLREEVKRIEDEKKRFKHDSESGSGTHEGSRIKYLLKESGEGAVISWLRYIADTLDSDRNVKVRRGMVERGEVTKEQFENARDDESGVDYIPYDYWKHERD